MKKLSDITQAVRSELGIFDNKFKLALKSRVPLLDKISYYIVKTKGKQFRPMISLLVGKMIGQINEKSYSAAMLIELLHTATLVHDDVVDHAYQRRGFFSINALWKNKIAVLVGDYLLSRGLLTALENKHFDLLELLSVAVKEMSEGELLQLEKSRQLNITEEVYYKIIRQKTASLITAACSCGAKAVGATEQQLELIALFGEKLGLAYQIKDDLMDINQDASGKPKILDIKEKKLTLPLIYALSQAPASQSKEIIKGIRKRSEDPEVIRNTLNFIFEYQGDKYAEKQMHLYRDQAITYLDSFEMNESKQALLDLCVFVTERHS